eukprot:tig00000880_g5181.t1
MPVSYLEEYLQSVKDLPDELKANFKKLRELDARVNDILKNLQTMTEECVAASRKETKEGMQEYERIRKEIEKEDKEAQALSDQKVQLAYSTYELVDQHIRRLDSDMKKYEEEMKQERNKQEQPFPSEQRKDKNVKSLSPRGKGTVQGHAAGKGHGRKRPSDDGAGPDAGDPRVRHLEDDLPIDPNEPVYCYCRQVSFGEMVACDNSDCQIEWFHFQCVGLTQTPKGKWYCKECSAAMRRGRIGRPVE